MKNELRRLAEIIEQNNEFLLLSHIDPDGDAIGSLVALLMLLKRKGKKAVAYERDGVPRIYSFLKGSEEITSVVPSSGNFDAAIFLECPNVTRAGSECKPLIDTIPLWVNLDHHVDNEGFGHLNVVKPELSAIAMIVYELFNEMNEPIDIIVAEAIYAAIMTDTGSYKYSNTSPRSHEISGELIKLGIKPYEIYQKIYEDLSIPAALIAARAHSTMEIDNGISCITITRAMLEETGASPEDTHDIVSLGRAIGSVEVALLFRETEDNIKVSLRSKGRVDVNKIAVGFKGGGHLRAAGCNINGSMQDVKKQVVTAVREALKQAENSAEDTHEH